MKPEQAFEDLGIDAMTGVRLMGMLNLTPFDFRDPARFTRFHQIIDYFKNIPEDTQNFLISRVTTGKIGDKLDKVFEYTQLLEKKQTIQKNLDNINKESSILSLETDPIIREAAARKQIESLSQLSSSLKTVESEISIYEK